MQHKRKSLFDKTPTEYLLEVYFDGSCHPNPGVGSVGVYIRSDEVTLVMGCSIDYNSFFTLLGLDPNKITNNDAEWAALAYSVFLISLTSDFGCRKTVLFRGDSQNVINAVSGEWNCKVPRHNAIRNYVWETLDMLGITAKYEWVPREQNSIADSMASMSLRRVR